VLFRGGRFDCVALVAELGADEVEDGVGAPFDVVVDLGVGI
jgi:hypothetical protein